MKDRIPRLNSLLREVISDVIRKEMKNPAMKEIPTVTRVDVSRDIRHAKVYISSLGSPEEKKELIAILKQASGFIGAKASKEVVLRYFPELNFIIDDSVEKHMRVETLLRQIDEERKQREHKTNDEPN